LARQCGAFPDIATVAPTTGEPPQVVIRHRRVFTSCVAGSRRQHIGLEIGLASVSGTLFLLTLFWADWIEAIFGIDPDGGSGAVEFLVASAFLVLALVAGRLAIRALRTT
jgi:hypothetical protein